MSTTCYEMQTIIIVNLLINRSLMVNGSWLGAGPVGGGGWGGGGGRAAAPAGPPAMSLEP